MAWELPSQCVGNLVAAADLSADDNQYRAVTITGANAFGLCSVVGEPVFGILQDKPKAGAAGDIMTVGISKLRVGAGETLVAGGYWGTDASGNGKAIQISGPDVDTGEYVAGRVIEGAAAGELATVSVGYPTFIVP